MRGLIRTTIVLGISALAGAAVVAGWPIGTTVNIGMISGDAYRGAYLARSSGCIACHTNGTANGQALAGGAPLDTPFGSFVPPNISPDPEHGIGGWTLNQFAVAVRQGIRPDGKPYYPAFPYEFYAEFSDQDIADLWAAFQTVPGVTEASVPHSVGFPFNMRWGIKLWRAAWMTPAAISPVMGKSKTWNRGLDLVNGGAHCAACHTGRNLFGGLKASEAMAGNDTLPGGSSAPAIRSAGLRTDGWTVGNLTYALRTGIKPNGDVLGGSMAEVVEAGTSYLSDADRLAIATFLLDQPDEPGIVPAEEIETETIAMVHTAGMNMNGN